MCNSHEQTETVREATDVLPRPLRRRDFRWPLIAAVSALCLIPFTNSTYAPILAFLQKLPIEELFSTTRQITGATVLGTIFLVFLLIAPSRWRLAGWWLGAALLLGCVTNSTIKNVAGRVRPEFGIGIVRMDDSDAGYERMSRFVAQNPGSPMKLEQKDQWMIGKPGRPMFNSMTVSFPSGHTMTAFCLAGFFSLLFPHGKWLWYVWAFGCALARVWGRRHFLDDTLMGAAVGHCAFLIACSWAWPGILGAYMNRYIDMFQKVLFRKKD